MSGVEKAVAAAKQLAGDRDASISSASVIQHALDLDLVDEVAVSLVSVLFGEGVAYFGALRRGHVMLGDPEVIQGRRATYASRSGADWVARYPADESVVQPPSNHR